MNPLLEKLKKSAQKDAKSTNIDSEIIPPRNQNKIEQKLQKMVEEKTQEMKKNLLFSKKQPEKNQELKKPWLFAKKQPSEKPLEENSGKIQEKKKPWLFAKKQPSEKQSEIEDKQPEEYEPKQTKKQKSIISLVQQMVKDGMSEPEIVSSLKEMGVDEQQAKRLVMLGYSDTFNIIKKEMEQEITKSISTERQAILQDVQRKIQKMENQSKAEMDSELESKKQNLSQDLEKKFNIMEQKLGASFSAFLEDLKTTKGDMIEVKTKQRKIDRELQELEAVGIGKRNKILAYFLVFMGVLFSIISSYLGFSFLSTFAIEILIIVVATALLGITFLFIATLV